MMIVRVATALPAVATTDPLEPAVNGPRVAMLPVAGAGRETVCPVVTLTGPNGRGVAAALIVEGLTLVQVIGKLVIEPWTLVALRS